MCQEKIFHNEEEYLFHILNVHGGKTNDNFVCSDCGKQYKTKSELSNHINSKCGTIKLYRCEVNTFLICKFVYGYL